MARNPNSATAHARLGMALADASQWEASIAELKKASTLAPKDVTIEYNLGLVYLQKARRLDGEDPAIRKQDLQNSMQVLLRISKQDSQLPDIHRHLGWLFHELGDPTSSLREFHAATIQDPNSADAYNDYGTALGQHEQFDLAIHEYRKAIFLNPHLISATLNLETAAHRAGKDADQLQWSEEQVKVNNGSALAHALLGSALVRDQQFERASTELKLAIQIDPKLSFAHYRMGEVLLADNRLADAENEFRAALKQDPDTPDFLNALALVLLRENRLADAVALLRQAVRHDPSQYALHLKLARALQDLGDRKGAASEFARGAALMRRANNLGQVKMLVSSAVGDLRDGQVEHALRQLKSAEELLPDHPETNYYLAIALAESGDYAAANAAFERALSGRPDSAEMHYNFGIALWQQQQAESAIFQFRDAIRLSPNDAQAHCALALSLLRSGQLAEGKQQLKNAQTLGACGSSLAGQGGVAAPGAE